MKYGVSFICPAYNHERFINEFIQSVTSQTNDNWELIIIDDHSSDNTYNIAKSYENEKIKIIRHLYNKGINSGINDGVSIAMYDYVSFVASDDVIKNNYVDTIIEIQKNTQYDVIYTPLEHIDENGKKTTWITHLPYEKTPEEVFALAFIRENQIPSPGMAIKKNHLLKFIPLPIGVIQYQDWQLHFLLMYKSNVYFHKTPLILYREVVNSASRVSTSDIRCAIETDILMDTVVNLIGNDVDAFIRYFGNMNKKNYKVTPDTIPFLLGMVALDSPIIDKQKWGLKKIMYFINNESNMEILNKEYSFDFKKYLGLAMKILNNSNNSELFKKVTEYENALHKIKSKKQKRKHRRKKTQKIMWISIVICLFSFIFFILR